MSQPPPGLQPLEDHATTWLVNVRLTSEKDQKAKNTNPPPAHSNLQKTMSLKLLVKR